MYDTLQLLIYDDEAYNTLITIRLEQTLITIFFYFISSVRAVKPFFNKEPSDLTVLAGQTVQFHCSVGGDPQPQILWRKDDGNMPVGR